jgi:hypothetical protein
MSHLPTIPGCREMLALLAILTGCLAPACGPRPENIQVTVIAILATDRDKEVDEKIKCIAEELHKKHPELTGFREARTTRKSLPVGDEESFPLVDEKDATIRIHSGADKDNWVSLTLKTPGQGEIRYSVRCGKCVPFGTSYVTKDNRRLFLAVLVKPCNKGK